MFHPDAPPRIETPRLILDAHGANDLDALAAMWADPEVFRQISGQASSRQESWFRLLRYRGLWPVLGYGYWAIREKGTGRFVGEIGFADFERVVEPMVRGLPEAGWVLARWAHGQGFASEALHSALAWLDQSTSHDRAVCLIGSDNLASIRVAEKNGFHRDGSVSGGSGTTHLLTRTRGS